MINAQFMLMITNGGKLLYLLAAKQADSEHRPILQTGLRCHPPFAMDCGFNKTEYFGCTDEVFGSAHWLSYKAFARMLRLYPISNLRNSHSYAKDGRTFDVIIGYLLNPKAASVCSHYPQVK